MAAGRDTWLTEFELVDLLHHECTDDTQRALAKRCGVSNQFLSQVLNRNAAPGEKIPEAMGYEAVTLYRPIEGTKKEEL